MIRIENLELEMRVLARGRGTGTVKDLRLSPIGTCYVTVEFDDGSIMDIPNYELVKW
jgi:hypothetical protein